MGLPSDQHVFPDPKAIINGVIVFNTYCDWLRTRRMIQAGSISPQAVGLEIAIQFNSSEKELKKRNKAIFEESGAFTPIYRNHVFVIRKSSSSSLSLAI
jgi:hypothetical protein